MIQSFLHRDFESFTYSLSHSLSLSVTLSLSFFFNLVSIFLNNVDIKYKFYPRWPMRSIIFNLLIGMVYKYSVSKKFCPFIHNDPWTRLLGHTVGSIYSYLLRVKVTVIFILSLYSMTKYSDPFYILTHYNAKWETTSWTYSMFIW